MFQLMVSEHIEYYFLLCQQCEIINHTVHKYTHEQNRFATNRIKIKLLFVA